MRKYAVSVAVLMGLLLCGCEKSDPTTTAAPPASPGANAVVTPPNKQQLTLPAPGGGASLPGGGAPQMVPAGGAPAPQ